MLEAAAELLAVDDVHELTVSAVATQAELTTGAFYRYFRDLDELLQELAEIELAKATEVLRPIFAREHESAVAMWLDMVDGIVAYLEEERVMRVIFQHRRRTRVTRLAAGRTVEPISPWRRLADYLDGRGLLSGELDDYARLQIELLWLQTEELLDRAFREGVPADPQVCRVMRENLQAQAALL